MQQVDFIFDFGSPNAYLAHHLIPGIEERTGSKFNYIPCLLGGIFKATGNKPPMVALSDVKAKLAYENLEMQRFIKEHQIEFNFNPHFPVNTLLLVRGAIVAEQEGFLADYIDQGLNHMWRDPKKMDDPEVFAEAMNQSGFDGAGMLEKMQDPEVKQRLMDNTSAAVDRGVFGIPTFFVGSEMFFGKDRLGQVEQEINRSS
ncbi:MAG: 2-hydroxychromene-2-carboxylate isomerase [Pseudomonadota bacterium]